MVLCGMATDLVRVWLAFGVKINEVLADKIYIHSPIMKKCATILNLLATMPSGRSLFINSQYQPLILLMLARLESANLNSPGCDNSAIDEIFNI